MGLFRRLYSVARSQLRSGGLGARDVETTGPAEAPPARATDDLAAGYYANLELPEGAGYSAIKSAYRRLLKRYHPDRHARDAAKVQMAEEIVKRLNEAMAYFDKEHEGGRL